MWCLRSMRVTSQWEMVEHLWRRGTVGDIAQYDKLITLTSLAYHIGVRSPGGVLRDVKIPVV